MKSRDNAGALQGKYSKTMQKNRTAACARANPATAAYYVLPRSEQDSTSTSRGAALICGASQDDIVSTENLMLCRIQQRGQPALCIVRQSGAPGSAVSRSRHLGGDIVLHLNHSDISSTLPLVQI